MDSLLLIPDISGFTTFVNQTEIKHSKHIISELLELIIESDELRLTVSEIEGDAVLFYRKGNVPGLNALFEQTKKTFLAFHTHLKNYEVRRICPCGACCTAHTLKIKFVALRADLDFIKVKNFEKPYGSDVILAHRLLKNDVANSEYVLVHSGYCKTEGVDQFEFAGKRLLKGSTVYRDFGEVSYHYLTLENWHEQVPLPDPPPVFERITNPVRVEGPINKPLFKVYELISNLDLRLQWNTGVEKLDYEADRVNRVGTRHRCVVQGNLIDFETIVADFGTNTLVYGERVEDNPLVKRFAVFWILEETKEGVYLIIEMHYYLKPFPMSLIEFFFRWNARRQLRGIFSRIKEIAERK